MAQDVLYEKYFHCFNLGTQLKPFIEEFLASEENTSRKPAAGVPNPDTPIKVNNDVTVPTPFELKNALHNCKTGGMSLPLDITSTSFSDSQGEFVVRVFNGESNVEASDDGAKEVIGWGAADILPREMFVWAVADGGRAGTCLVLHKNSQSA